MRRLILVVLAIIAFGTAYAQLEIVANAKPSECIESARAKTIRLVKSGPSYMIVMTNTGNRFDSPAIFHLGESKTEAKKTLIDMINFCDSAKHKEAIFVANLKKRVTLVKWKRGGKFYLSFFIPGVAGKSANVERNEMSKFCRALSAYNE